MSLNILFAGDGGQGIQLISDLICDAVLTRGWQVSQIPNFGLEQRGGVSLSFVKISDTKIVYPKFAVPNILVVMSTQAQERVNQYQKAEIVFSFEDYGGFLKENGIPASSHNIFYLGKLSRELVNKDFISSLDVLSLLKTKLEGKNNLEVNIQAFELGFSQ